MTPGYSLAESALRAKDSISNLFLIFRGNDVGCGDRERTGGRVKTLLDSRNIYHKRLTAPIFRILLSKRRACYKAVETVRANFEVFLKYEREKGRLITFRRA